jgi:uncharacterized protein
VPDPIAQFADAKYLNLETFRKTGLGVRTPLWFAQDPQIAPGNTAGLAARFYVYSLPDVGKVKRIRNNPKVRIAPCTMRGELRGAWVEASARICPPEEGANGQTLLRRKYGLLKIVGELYGKIIGRKNVTIAIELD